uniref:Uncharacterized protein n=1 Tax=Babesia bovis TaxID=5865 RepID=S6BLV6_BABBO|nr:hypothetical protein [Babesia bovis]
MWKTALPRFFSVMRRHYPDEVPLELLRQKALLVENFSPKLLDTQSHVIEIFAKCGMHISQDDVHIMRNRFGIPCGRVLILVESLMTPNFHFGETDSSKNTNSNVSGDVTDQNVSHQNETATATFFTKAIQKTLLDQLPPEARTYICDEHDVKCYVEQCERYLTLSEELRKLADPTNLHRIVTVTGMNKSYGRLELAEVIKKHTSVLVKPTNIVFRFKSNGEQEPTAWVLCDTISDANRLIAELQEVAIPKRYQYGSLMGASFLYSARSSLFLSHPELDFITSKSKYQIPVN